VVQEAELRAGSRDSGARITYAGPRTLVRNRFDAHVASLRDGPARLLGVWGAAGSGKTTLLAAWARRAQEADQTVLWVSATELRLDADIETLLAYLARPPAEALVIVDDLHRLGPRAHNLAERLLDTPQRESGIVLAGRFDPSGRHAYLEASGALIDIREAELACTPDEVLEMARLHGLDLSRGSAERLVRRTGGWMTGVALAIPWLLREPAPDRAIRRFDGNHRAIADFLTAEIIADLDAGDRAVLMDAAVQSCVPLGLAIALTGRVDAGSILHRLAAHNALITEDLHDETFTYHPILLAFLQAENRRRDFVRAHDRHRVAADWYAARGSGPSALTHAALSGMPEAAEAALDEFGLEVCLTGPVETVQAASSTVGSLAGPAAAALRMLVQWPLGVNTPESRHALREVEAALAAARQPTTGAATAQLTRWSAVLVALRAWALSPDDDEHDDDAAAETASALRSPDVCQAREAYLFLDLLCLTAEGLVSLRMGRGREAATRLSHASESARAAGLPRLAAIADDLAREPARQAHDWRQFARLEIRLTQMRRVDASADPVDAHIDLIRDLRAWEASAPSTSSTTASFVDMSPSDQSGVGAPRHALSLLMRLGDGADPSSALTAFEAWAFEWGRGHPTTVATAALAWFSAVYSQRGRSEAVATARFVTATLGPGTLEEVVMRAAVADTKNRASALADLRAALGGGVVSSRERASAWRGTTEVCAWIMVAHTAEAVSRLVEADAAVRRAVELAEAIDCVRAFSFFDAAGVRLLQNRRGRLGHADDYAQRILERTGFSPTRTSVGQTGTLTAREFAVLRELPAHQSVAEIARRHSVSVNTVKTHLRSIYQKLGANDRTHAIAIAHDLGLL
jgi:LuxR family maltose regulon positive regulatory protein